MAKKVKVKKKGSKRILSIIFHLIVLVVMVNIYDAARALISNKNENPPKSENQTKGGKGSSSSKSSGIGKVGNKLKDTKGKMEERGTSMEDLMAEKQRREKEKAGKAAPEQKAK